MSAPEIVLDEGGVRVERVVTHGVFELDGGRWEVDNNVWLVGNDDECVVIDAAHSAGPIVEAIGGRRVAALLLTHGHNDHINAVNEVLRQTQAAAYLHPGDTMLWHEVYDTAPDEELADGRSIEVAGLELTVLHTPGHSPGAVCFQAPTLGAVFTGDTLFEGGPGATDGRSYTDYDLIVASITSKLFVLPDPTRVFTGHGDSTTIGSERARQSGWKRPAGA